MPSVFTSPSKANIIVFPVTQIIMKMSNHWPRANVFTYLLED